MICIENQVEKAKDILKGMKKSLRLPECHFYLLCFLMPWVVKASLTFSFILSTGRLDTRPC